MERAALEHIQNLLAEQMRERIPGDAIERVAVLQYGDDPMVEPGELLVRVYVASGAEKEERAHALEQFHDANREAIFKLRDELLARVPQARRLEFRAGDDEDGPRMMLRGPRVVPEGRALGGPELTPVMARLSPADLETLDTLITSGIAGSRADAVRWTIARVRERPAFERLREHVHEIEELKAQF